MFSVLEAGGVEVNSSFSQSCVTDIDECDSEIPVCKGVHEECTNTDGSYICGCVEGYSKQDGVCAEDKLSGKFYLLIQHLGTLLQSALAEIPL